MTTYSTPLTNDNLTTAVDATSPSPTKLYVAVIDNEDLYTTALTLASDFSLTVRRTINLATGQWQLK